MDKPMSDLEEILRALYESEINASITWVWDGGIIVDLGDPLNGYDADDKVGTFAEVTAWLRDQACKHYPDSEFARKYGGFGLHAPPLPPLRNCEPPSRGRYRRRR
jgi:hypothetical protein